MGEQAQKNFGPIADDYSFFERHATEAAADARAYAAQLKELSSGDGTIRMLDFGCGSGTFTERLLRLAGWPTGRLQLTLVEPVESVRRSVAALVEAVVPGE